MVDKVDEEERRAARLDNWIVLKTSEVFMPFYFPPLTSFFLFYFLFAFANHNPQTPPQTFHEPQVVQSSLK
jgi:hypothetical protein